MPITLPPELLLAIFQVLVIEQPPETRSSLRTRCTHAQGAEASRPYGYAYNYPSGPPAVQPDAAYGSVITPEAASDQSPSSTTIAHCATCHLRRLGWVTITHVCGSWRTIALSAPSLWTSIDCDALNDNFIEMFLKNSQQNMLDVLSPRIELWINGQAGMSKASVIERAHPRIKTLVVDHSGLVALRNVIARHPLSRLRSLTVQGVMDTQDFPEPLEILKPSNLRELRITGYVYGAAVIHNPSLHNLRLLSIDICNGSCSTILEVLRPMSQLEVFRLRNFGTTELMHGGDIIELPRCREISLQNGHDTVIATILSLLRLPVDARFHLWAEVVCENLYSIQCLAALRSHYQRGGYWLHGRSLSAHFSHSGVKSKNGSFALEWTISTLSRPEPNVTVSEFAVRLSCTTLVSAQARDCLATEHVELFGLASLLGVGVHELRMSPSAKDNVIDPHAMLQRHFYSWTSLERIRVAGIDLISAVVDDLTPRHEHALPFPALTEISLLDFPMWMLVNDWNELKKRLLLLLRSRSNLGAPIRLLKFSNTDLLKGTTLWAELLALTHVCKETQSDNCSSPLDTPERKVHGIPMSIALGEGENWD
ncbi:unnamed protein product [Peniophora sp. CBMAI 1063]|nr:unnamed protein product [Peniophora sp. CBMAI 1063]